MTGERSYLSDLEHALVRGGLDEERAGDVIREMSDHLDQSGEDPVEAFGEPEPYAATLLAADGPGAGATSGYESQTFRATAFDELDILARLGAEGWELTGVRDFGLHARRPLDVDARQVWRYERRTGVRRGPVVASMEASGWTPCGHWVTYHYFKRPAGQPS